MTTIIGGKLAHCALVLDRPLAPVEADEARLAWQQSKMCLSDVKRVESSRLAREAAPLLPLLRDDDGDDRLVLWVDQPRKAHHSARARARCLHPGICEGSLVRLWPDPGEPFREDGVYVASAALQFLDAARRCNKWELAALGMALCGTYDGRPDTQRGFRDRAAPWTNTESLRTFLDDAAGSWGAERAAAALDLVMDGSASPEETAVALLLSMSAKDGGYALGPFALNRPVGLSAAGVRAYGGTAMAKPDIYIEACRVDVEYDSDAEHKDPERRERDARRKAALEVSGIHVIPLLKDVLYDRCAMDSFARTVGDAVGRAPGRPILRAQLHARQVLLGSHRFW